MFNDAKIMQQLRDWVDANGEVDEDHPYMMTLQYYIFSLPHQTHFIERLMSLLSFIKAKKHRQKERTTSNVMKVSLVHEYV